MGLLEGLVIVSVILLGEEFLLELSRGEGQTLVHHSLQVVTHRGALKGRTYLSEGQVDICERNLQGFPLQGDRELREVLDQAALTQETHEFAGFKVFGIHGLTELAVVDEHTMERLVIEDKALITLRSL